MFIVIICDFLEWMMTLWYLSGQFVEVQGTDLPQSPFAQNIKD